MLIRRLKRAVPFEVLLTAFYITLMTFIFRKMILVNGIVVYEDISMPLTSKALISQVYPLWNIYGEFTVVRNILRLPLISVSYVLVKYLHFDAYWIEKILYVLLPALGGTIAFVCSKELIKLGSPEFSLGKNSTVLRGVALTSSVIYMLSPVIFANNLTHLYFFPFYYSLPLVWLLLVRTLVSKRGLLRYVGLTLLVMNLCTTDVAVVGYYVVFLLIIFILRLIEGANIKNLIILAILVLYLVSYLPVFLLVPKTTASFFVVDRQYLRDQSRQSTLLNTFKLIGGYAYLPGSYRGYVVYKPSNIVSNILGLIPFILFLIAIIGLRKKGIAFMLIATFIIILAMGMRSPASRLYEFIVAELPGGLIFRKPDKFLFYLSFMYYYTISIGLYSFLVKIDMSRGRRTLLAIAVIPYLVLFSIFGAYPEYLSGDFGGTLSPVTLPKDFEIIRAIADNEKTVFLPPFYGRQVVWNKGKYTEENVYVQNLPPTPNYGAKDYLTMMYIYSLYNHASVNLTRILNPLGAKYLAVFYDFTGYYVIENEPMILRKLLSAQPSIFRIFKSKYVELYRIAKNADSIVDMYSKVYVIHNWPELYALIQILDLNDGVPVLVEELDKSIDMELQNVTLVRVTEIPLLRLVNMSRIVYRFNVNELESRMLLIRVAGMNSTLIDIGVIGSNDNRNKTLIHISTTKNEIIVPIQIPESYKHAYLTIKCGETCSANISYLGINEPPNKTSSIHKAIVKDIIRLSDTHYRIMISSNTSFILVFKMSYDDGWRAIVRGETTSLALRPFKVFGAVNGFYIPITGNITVDIQYAPQAKVVLGLLLPYLLASIILIAGILSSRLRHQTIV